MEKFELIDNSRGRYLIHHGGEIQRTDMQFNPSQSWRLVGLSHTGLHFGNLAVRFEDITPEWLAANPLLHKNGKPRYTVCDFDHGTIRIWANQAGVSSIRFDVAKIARPVCKFCELPAEFIAAQSSDAGATVEWTLICLGHRAGWNDGGDWPAPVYPLGAPQS